jgi:hypothetical protein
MTAGARTVRAPRGTSLSCRGWIQEAALRMLMNNLDPEVAERPQDLIVYGGAGKAARELAVLPRHRAAVSGAWRTMRHSWCSRASRWASFARTTKRRAS